ncbi:MAG: ferrous iron transporter B, partial [Actinomycetia bacterium]|nr:ferrous iron transporter B [Actinomycetes bacterium]
MHNHRRKKEIKDKNLLLLVGNPNVGKSVIFSYLTGKYVNISNYPGTTVEIYKGQAEFKKDLMVIDTPGVNSLLPHSEDEEVTLNIVLESEKDKKIIQVGDAKNLRRTLLISIQLAEMEVPYLLSLNMMDEAEIKGIKIDNDRLGKILGVKAIKTVAIAKKGLGELKDNLDKIKKSKLHVKYDKHIQDAIKRISKLLPEMPVAKKSIALMILSKEKIILKLLQEKFPQIDIKEIKIIVNETKEHYSDPLSYVISKYRSDMTENILKDVRVKEGKVRGETFLDYLGRATMHPVTGVPFLLLVLCFIYLFVGYFGAGIGVDFFESVIFGKYFNPFAIKLFSHLKIPFLVDFFVGEYGLVTMGLTYAFAIVFPIVTSFFLAFSILEDTGYLPRLAIITNKVFKKIGLNGKAVLPMIL